MRIQRAFAPLLLTVFLLCSAAVPGAAQTSAPTPASSLIHVSHCNPSLNVSQSGGFYRGYTPGFYRGGFWGDPYGVRYYQPPVTTTNPQLAIDYKNISPKTMHEIEFGLIANRNLVAEVRDVGTFSTGAEIKHKFGISPNVFPIHTGLPQCVALRITFADGTKWRNPLLPPKNSQIYYHP